jgi:hypothetical protein
MDGTWVVFYENKCRMYICNSGHAKASSQYIEEEKSVSSVAGLRILCDGFVCHYDNILFFAGESTVERTQFLINHYFWKILNPE